MIWPLAMLATIMVIVIGIITVPLWVALVPITPWMNSGTNRIVPNMPIVTQNIARVLIEMIGFLNNESGMIGSAARDSTIRNVAVITAATPNMASTWGELQAY